MADNNLKISIVSTLDKAKSISEINSVIGQIAKDPTLKSLSINIGVTDSQVNKVVQQISQIQEKLKGLQQQQKPLEIVPSTQFNEFYTSIDKAIEKYNQLGQVKISQDAINPLTGQIEKFTLSVTKGAGEVEKFKFQLSSLKGIQIGENTTSYIPTVFSSTNSTQAVQSAQIDKITQALSKMYDQGMVNEKFFDNFNKAINSAENIAQLDKLQSGLERVSQYAKNQNLQASLLSQSQSLLGSGKNVDTIGLSNLIRSLDEVNLSSSNATRELSLMQSQLRGISSTATSAITQTTTLGDAFKHAFMPLSMYFGGFMLFMQGINAIKGGISTVNDLNKSLTEISIVTYQSQQQVAALGDSYNKLAQQMGVTTSDIANEATELYRQGLSADQVTERMKTITEYAKISSIDTKTASEIMTAAINSMGVSGQKAADVWAYLGDATATDASEIGKAMQKVGSSAGELQIPFEQVSSWIAVISSKTRLSAETIGDSIKSILARMQSLKEKGFDQTDGTQVNQVSKSLAEVGIQLVDSQGNFRNFGKVMDELGTKWDSLSGREKSYLATTLAGTYQQSNFLALMNGYGQSVSLYQNALDSAGTAQQKFNLYQQGTEAQLDKLKASWEGMWMSAFKSNDLQTVIGSLNGLVSTIKLLVDNFGALPPILGIAGTAFLLFNTKARESIALLQVGLLNSIKASVTELGVLATVTKGTGVALGFFWDKLKAIGGFVWDTALPVVAIMAVGYAIEKVTEAIEKQKQAQEELKQQQDDLRTKFSANSDEIQKLASDYENLSKQVQNGQIDKTNQQYVDTMNKLGQLMPSIVQSVDEQGNKTLIAANAVKDELNYAKQLKTTYDQMNVGNLVKDIQNQADQVDQILKKIKDAKKEENNPYTQKVGGKGVVVSVAKDTDQKFTDQLQELAYEKQLQDLLHTSSTFISEKANALMDIDKITNKLSSSQKDLIDGYIKEATASKNSVKDGADLKKFLEDTTNKAVELAKILGDLPNVISNIFSAQDFSGMDKNQLSVLQSIGTEVKSGYTQWDSYQSILLKVFHNTDTVNKILGALKNTTKENTKSQVDYNAEVQKMITDGMDKANTQEKTLGTTQSLINQTKDLITAYQLLSNQENLSAEQTQQLADAKGQLIALYPQYVQNGQLQVEQMRKEAESEDILLKAINDVANGHATAEEMMTTNAALQSKSRIQMISDQIAAYQKLIDTVEASAEADGGEMTGARSNAISGASSKIADLKSQVDSLTKSYSSQIQKLAQSTNYQGQYYDGTKQSTYVSDKYKQSIDALNASISNLESLQKNYAEDSQQYRDALQQEITLLNQKNNLIQTQSQSLQQQIASGNITQYGIVNSGGSGSTSTSLSGGSTQQQIWNFLKSNGLSDGAVAGIMGNLQQESGFNTSITNSIGATGLAQWLGDRLSNLKDYANSTGTNYTDLSTQLGFLWKELSSGNYGSISSLNNMSASDAASYFESNFEISGGSAVGARQNFANQIYSQYTGTGGGNSSGSGSQTAAQNAQSIDQANSELLQLQQDSFNTQQQIKQLQIAIEQSKIDSMLNPLKETITDIDLAVKNSQLAMKRFSEGSKEWNWELTQQISLQQRKIATNQQEEQTVQNLLNTENLSDQQKKDLTNQYLQLDSATYQYLNDLNDLYDQERTAMVDADVKNITDAYNEQIDALKTQLDLLDKQAQAQDRLNQLNDLQNQINKAKSDTSHEYIDSNGQVTFTYDKTQVSDLQKQMSDLQSQWSQQDQKDALNQQINDLTTQRDDSINRMKQLLTDYTTKGFQNTTDLQNIMNQFIQNLAKIYNVSITVPKHHDGGIVGSVASGGKLANLVNNLFNVKPNEQIVKALKGEIMVPEANVPNFIQNMQSFTSGLISKSNNAVQQIIKHYNFNGMTIKTDNLEGLLSEIDTITRSQ